MAIYMLHFACTPTRNSEPGERWTADLCAIVPSLEEAESTARELIEARGYHADELIAYATVDEHKVAALSQLEATLYLRALQAGKQRAVAFSQWHEES